MTVRDSETLKSFFVKARVPTPSDYIDLIDTIFAGAGGGGHTIQDEGVDLTQRTNLDFQGTGVTVTDGGEVSNKTIVTIPMGGHTIEDENTPLTKRNNLDFQGVGVTVTDGGGVSDSTVVTIPGGADNLKVITFDLSGGVYISTGAKRLANTFGRNFNIEEVEIMVGTAPTGGNITVDIHKNGVTIFTNQAHRPVIVAGANQGTTTTIDVPSWNDGDYLTMDIDGIGTTIAGADLTCMVRARTA